MISTALPRAGTWVGVGLGGAWWGGVAMALGGHLVWAGVDSTNRDRQGPYPVDPTCQSGGPYPVDPAWGP